MVLWTFPSSDFYVSMMFLNGLTWSDPRVPSRPRTSIRLSALPPFSFPLGFRTSVSFPTNFSTGWRMPFSWLPTEGRLCSAPPPPVSDA